MRKKQKEQILEILQTLNEAHGVIKNDIASRELSNAHALLAECQQTAIGIGEMIEITEGEACIAVRLVEDYCERLYEVSEDISKNLSSQKAYKLLNQSLIRVENSVKQDIAVRLEAVFLPYKASMWDSLESIWKAADEDPACDAYVIPIPYYDRNHDGSFGQEHYEGALYPDYVPVTKYDEYDFQGRHPDVIFIHNPYDNCNYVTSVHPAFYSSELKKYTHSLIYIPYFILDEISPKHQEAIEHMEHFCTVPGVLHADKVIVQSEDMRQIYIDVLTRNAGKATRNYWERKILGLGSPKVDKAVYTRKEDVQIPEDWMQVIKKPSGEWKKIILYNTAVGALLHNEGRMIEKMQRVFHVFKENQEDVALLWRPHPLIKATIESMLPQLWESYSKLVHEYKEDGWGIYDDSPELNRAIALCDGYYGDYSSLVRLCKEAGLPVMVQNVEI